jgi:hypothetical protein
VGVVKCVSGINKLDVVKKMKRQSYLESIKDKTYNRRMA